MPCARVVSHYVARPLLHAQPCPPCSVFSLSHFLFLFLSPHPAPPLLPQHVVLLRTICSKRFLLQTRLLRANNNRRLQRGGEREEKREEGTGGRRREGQRVHQEQRALSPLSVHQAEPGERLVLHHDGPRGSSLMCVAPARNDGSCQPLAYCRSVLRERASAIWLETPGRC